jgi:hypothetical protein
VSRAAELEEQKLVLQARCRMLGLDPSKEENLRVVKHPMMETPAGQAVMARVVTSSGGLSIEDAVDLFNTMTHIWRVRTRFLRAIGAPRPNAKTMKLEFMRDPVEATEDHEPGPPEPLAPEEEYARAKAAHENLQGWVRGLPPDAAREVARSVVWLNEPLDVAALMEGLEGIRQKLRGK